MICHTVEILRCIQCDVCAELGAPPFQPPTEHLLAVARFKWQHSGHTLLEAKRGQAVEVSR